LLGGPWGLAAVVSIKHFGAIKEFALGIVRAVRQAIENLVNWVESLPGKVGGALKKIPGAGLASRGAGAVTGLFHRQHGGPVPVGGFALVGERGPEIIRARSALTVMPLPQPELSGGGGGAGLRPLEIVVPVMLDGREIARA